MAAKDVKIIARKKGKKEEKKEEKMKEIEKWRCLIGVIRFKAHGCDTS